MTKVLCSTEVAICRDAKRSTKTCDSPCMYKEPNSGFCVYHVWENC